MLDDRSTSLVRALLYPVQFEREPEAGVVRAYECVVVAHALGASDADYLYAIERALGSDESLSALIPQGHGEQAVRAYLAAMHRAITRARPVA